MDRRRVVSYCFVLFLVCTGPFWSRRLRRLCDADAGYMHSGGMFWELSRNLVSCDVAIS